jgi:hypothetical protein
MGANPGKMMDCKTSYKNSYKGNDEKKNTSITDSKHKIRIDNSVYVATINNNSSETFYHINMLNWTPGYEESHIMFTIVGNGQKFCGQFTDFSSVIKRLQTALKRKENMYCMHSFTKCGDLHIIVAHEYGFDDYLLQKQCADIDADVKST